MAVKSEVIIIGGGIIGISLAIILAKNNISTILIEKRKIEDLDKLVSDGRASAISHSSQLIYEKYDLWKCLANKAGPIKQIRVTDSESPLYIHFNNEIIDNKILGYMIENHYMINQLYNEAKNLPNLKIINNSNYDIVRDNYNVEISVDNEVFQASLLIAADGKNSSVRKKAYINYEEHFFKQTAIVCNVGHSLSHNNIAQEKFFEKGPFAILPLYDGYTSSIVWVEPTELANLYLKMDEEEFMHNLKRKFGNHLGDLKLISKIFSYNISQTHATKYYSERLALIGDAAHSIHPLAGQGLNLGIKDIDAIVNLIINAKKLGLDIGSNHILKKYEEARKNDNMSMLVITNSLNKIFSNDIWPIQITRKLGMSLINNLTSAKKFFMEYAMGIRK